MSDVPANSARRRTTLSLGTTLQRGGLRARCRGGMADSADAVDTQRRGRTVLWLDAYVAG
ncbi:MAG: hypothetical protein ACJAZO_001335 [Myxococcota bacterium]|jgi:hypothetical protein